jgi:hypothetical protein
MKSLQIVAAALGRKMGVRVRVDPNARTAYTDGKEIVLPLLREAPEEIEKVVMGLMVHESGHIRMRSGEPPKGIIATPLLGRLENCLEDIRIEAGMRRLYGGAKRHLDNLIEYAKARKWFAPLKGEVHPGALLCGAMLSKYRAEVLGNKLGSIPDSWESKAVSVFGQQLWDRICAIAEPATRAKSNAEVWEASNEILNLLKMQDQQVQSQGHGQDGQSQQGSDQDPGQQNPSQGNPDGSSQKACREALAAKEDDLPEMDIAKILAKDKKLEDACKPSRSRGKIGEIRPLGCCTGVPDLVFRLSEGIYRRIAGPLEAKLWARSQAEEYTALTGTRGIATSSLAQAYTTGRVFRRVTEGDTRDISVLLLVDHSGSMGQVQDMKPLAWANAGAVALAKVCSSLGIPVAVDGFNENYSICRPLQSTPITKANKMPWIASGGTALAGAVEIGASRLLQETSEEKILIVLTDAQIDQEEAQRLQVVDATATAEGLKVFYVVIAEKPQIGPGFPRDRTGVAPGDRCGDAIIEAFGKAMI